MKTKILCLALLGLISLPLWSYEEEIEVDFGCWKGNECSARVTHDGNLFRIYTELPLDIN